MNQRVFRSALDEKFYKCSGNPEIQRKFEAAGIVTPNDIADVEAVVILQEVLGLARPLYNLRNGCRVIPMDTLTHNIDVYSILTAEEKVPPMVEADIKKHGRSRVPFDLWKNVVHVAVSDEAGKKSAHNDLQLQIEDGAGALANSENSQIKTIMEAATNTSAGSNWATVTSGRSANNPYDDIMTAINTIRGTNGFKPDLVLAHPYVWKDFFSNDFVKGQLQGMVYPNTEMFDLPGMPGMKGLSDWSLTNTLAIVEDSRNAVVLGKGPTEAAKYRNELAGYDAYIIRDWLEPKIVQQGAIYTLTAVHA